MKSVSTLAAVAMVFGSQSSHATGSRPEPLGTVTGTVQAILALREKPNEIFLSTQNPGADCGKGTPASVWKLTLDPKLGKVIGQKKKQDLSKIQNTRNMLFEASDGTLFTGGGWCLYKPPYFSADGGETWQSADAGPVHPPNSTFSFAEFNGHVYAGTGYEPHHGQVYRWLGKGNWKRVFDIPPPRSIVQSMVVHKNRLFVSSHIYGWGGRGREKSVPVYVSSDGQTFEATEGIPPCYTVRQLLVVDGRLIAWTYEYGNSKKRCVYGFDGDCWRKIGELAQGITVGYATVSDGGAIFGWGQLPDDDRPGLYVSTDLGLAWKQLAVFEGISAVHANGKTLYLAARGDDNDTSQVYRIDLGDLRTHLAQGCACQPTPAKPPENDSDGPKIIARASGVYHDNSADKAFDGAPNTCWSAGDTPPQWIEANLGRRYGLKSIRLTVLQTEPWETAHEVWVSDEPMAGYRTGARRLFSFRGMTESGQVLKFDFPTGIAAQYVEVRTVESQGWTAWKEIDIQTVEEPVELTKGLVAHYSFDEDFKDRSGGGNHGVPYGDPKWVRGVLGAAAQFDGKDDCVSLGKNSALRQSTAITYSFWVKRPDIASHGSLIGAGAAGGHGFGGVSILGDAVVFSWTPSEPRADTCIVHNARSAPVLPGKWHHVVIASDYRKGQGAIYVDGARVAAALSRKVNDWTPAGSYSQGQIDSIGARFVNYWRFFRGQIDEVRIYDRALRPAEVLQLYQLARAGAVRNVTPLGADLNAYVIHGKVDGERTDLVDGVPESLARTLTRITRTVECFSCGGPERQKAAPWLYPLSGKYPELPRVFVEDGKTYYPILGTWRRLLGSGVHYYDENGILVDKGVKEAMPHHATKVDFYVVPADGPP